MIIIPLFFKMKQIALVLFVFFASSSICLAQKQGRITGIVTDSVTNEPIEFANVVLMSEDSTFITGVVTDSLGIYELNSQRINEGADYIIQVTHVCYDKKMVRSYQRGTEGVINLQLTSNNNSLPNIMVTGIRTKVRNRINFNYTFTDQMKEKVRLTSRLLENIPTVFVDCNSTVHIKGSSNILILKNGIELTDNSLVDQIAPESIMNVEIMYNVPSKYANQNYTAVMNITTKKEQGYSLMIDNKTSVDATMNDTKINLGLETEKSSIYLFYKQYYRSLKQYTENKIFDREESLLSNDKYVVSPRKECDNEFFYGYSFQANKRLQVGIDGYLSLYRERFLDRYDLPSQDIYAMKKEKVNTQNYKGYADYKDERNHFIAEISFNRKTIKDNDAYYTDKNLVLQNEDQGIYGIKADYNRKIGESAVLYSGIKFSHKSNEGVYNNRFSDLSENYHCNNLFAYGEFMKSIGDHWMVDAGLSFQNYHRSFSNGIKVKDTDIFPKFKISYAWDDNNNLALGYSSYLKEPSIWQMLSFIKKESSNLFTKGNPYLKPEKRGTLSLEYSYSKGNFYLETSSFLKITNNQIVNELSAEENHAILEYTNIYKSRDCGQDFTLSCHLAKWWNVSFYGDVRYRHIASNKSYKKNAFSYMGQIQSSWFISSRLIAIIQYTYNSKELLYNGYNKPYDSSTGMINYAINDYLDLYMVFVQPFGNLKGHTRIYNQTGVIDMRDDIHVRKIMLCLTFTLNKGKKVKKKEVYKDDAKKY